ncbi:MAG: quinolinate synthase NadA [Ignavibacteria bacterium]|nr:quinolinate synthase NadA [Ignavibacteria bacterium]
MNSNASHVATSQCSVAKLKEDIRKIKRQLNATILAHYYQESDIQDVADFVGDSYGLALTAQETDAEIIVFAGVKFMAETAKILNPSTTVLLPDMQAGCSLSESCPAEEYAQFRATLHDHVAITYINSSAEVKALSDIICTSSNAEKIVRSIPTDVPILFAPDKHLGEYLRKRTGRKITLWEGECVVHTAFSAEKLYALRNRYPDAKLVAHPECESYMLDQADFIGSATAMTEYVQKAPFKIFIIATEEGVLKQMRLRSPDKIFIPAPAAEDNECACSVCDYMKVNTLQKLYDCMLNRAPEVEISESIMRRAIIPLQRMIRMSV